MEIKQLITFKTAAENLNFTQTAKILNFAQSSVTAQIKALEAELGTALFERLGKRLFLTEAGRKFQLYANKMITLSYEAKMVVQDQGKSSGTLVIGAQESQCTYRLPSILKEFKTKFPQIRLIFKPAHSNEAVKEQLMEGKLDLAFILDTCKIEDVLHVESLIQEELKIVVCSNHPLLKNPIISTKDLESETFLLTELGCSYRTIFEELFRAEGVYPVNKIEFVSVEAIKQCVIAGLGIAILPAMVVEKEIQEGTIGELTMENTIDPIFTQIAWHKDKWITAPLQQFIDVTKASFVRVGK
ncbi:LysR family transcriptional regulator [Bacillus pseudomycoides]|uniref:LysR family transcriptional regulator n=1 Tax=Bacillus pseudomycoides TaxID=64104 RepID=UPI000BEC42E9|nr:LysR family transcriptional regulator [Bacillus pseudomycoides]PED06192.1 LysR family transcriptional regulator [Bacillus pseudomycoides]PEI94724.1 LysR family transcriptional regulator [Bacillus pseudomycoides]PEK19818.1 LysR family transcriptional regulator [Bacillus pseudomycoides]PEM71461.1 LysR family transcriptional regulator [Bacillus pseudomycoides]PEO06322.1 LysR family transcriptional regulator [Bacillus pseudomycoides]